MIQRRALLLSAGASLLLPACGPASEGKATSLETDAAEIPVTVTVPSAATQGQALNGTAPPGAEVSVGDATTVTNAQGKFVIGFDRDAAPAALVRVRLASGEESEHAVTVSARDYDNQTISQTTTRGSLFPAEWFDPEGGATDGDAAAVAEADALASRSLSAADAARIQRESALKREAFGSRDDTVSGFATAWVPPLQGVRISSPWGASRSVSTPQGRVRRTHYGIDIAALSNTQIVAPAEARVVLANDDLYYEGGCVFLDHGQGLVTVYLHMNSVDVAVGDVVQAGQQIGAVGSTGRATGPHLCWRMKWRNANLDPTLLLPGGAASLLRT
jgi:murein DD-endopeptidase MepM/ murein hydrolase activator NlpD